MRPAEPGVNGCPLDIDIARRPAAAAPRVVIIDRNHEPGRLIERPVVRIFRVIAADQGSAVRSLLKKQDLNLGTQMRSLLQGRPGQVQDPTAVFHVCLQHLGDRPESGQAAYSYWGRRREHRGRAGVVVLANAPPP